MTPPHSTGADEARHSDSSARAPSLTASYGLADLATLPLDEGNQRNLDRLVEDIVSGSSAWRERKPREARGLIALSQIAPRLSIRHLDLRTELITLVELRDTPVPCWPPGSAEIQIHRGAVLAIRYPEDILSRPIPGTSPIRILEPHFVFHSNVGPFANPTPSLCLGANVPRGFPLREIVLASYAALTLQAISLDTMDPAGVLNGDAATWWQANATRIPLTAEPFLGWRRETASQEGATAATAGDGQGGRVGRLGPHRADEEGRS